MRKGNWDFAVVKTVLNSHNSALDYNFFLLYCLDENVLKPNNKHDVLLWYIK